MRIYRVRLHEKQYIGSMSGGQICDVAVRASDIPQACAKALAYAKRQGFTACRASDVCEMTDIEELLT